LRNWGWYAEKRLIGIVSLLPVRWWKNRTCRWRRRSWERAATACSPRGCLLGPLVVAGISIDTRKIRKLKDLGVRDSKKLSPARREHLYPEIMKVSETVQWTMITPDEIDFIVTTGKKLHKLNYLEAIHFARVIDKLGASRVTVDASDVVPERFRDDIVVNLGTKCNVVAVHKADRDYPVVSAASIIAKVNRDREVDLLRKVHGEFGSGYPSDPTTRAFFKDRMLKGESLPGYVRKSWKTWGNLQQSLISSF
jgi:ribonuclease HII